ncbi:hypothetical protein GCM10009836_02690 [Pseudonocardia ailaonensis]|uniref:EthD domain-containing protein n=1 Tax=Pseudonocardia ailaonensis TaxID=367279 RepID=A0ABN2MJV4_9PSEU
MIRVKAAFFSFTAPPHAGPDYLRWHLLDHQPEQYQLPGIQLAMRYIADGAYPDGRLVTEGPLASVGDVTNYLVGDPVQQTHDDFLELGTRLAEKGRYSHRLDLIQLRMPALLSWHASPAAIVSAEVVPWRPHRGVLVIVEEPVGDEAEVASWLQWLHREHHPALLARPGTAGAWMYGSSGSWEQGPQVAGGPQYTTVVYLDEDPLATTAALRPLVEQRWASGAVRPLFAGPLRTMIDWEFWR